MHEKGRLVMFCPSCKKKLDGHMTTYGKIDNPRPGDYCLCFYCHEILVCTKGDKLKKISLNDVKNKETRETIRVALHLRKAQAKGYAIIAKPQQNHLH